ncbi:MAG: HAMP domain-containing histidine kinase [Bacteroidales bacterium]|nr:HAMP domain-containing histidine kinase [Bacteroidales bacterium]
MRRIILCLFLLLAAFGAAGEERDYYAEAEQLYSEGKFTEAVMVAREGLSRPVLPEEAAIELHSVLGACYARLGAFDKAAESIFRCYAYDKAHGEAEGLTSSLINLASMYVYAGEPNLAEDYALEAIRNEETVGRPDKLAMAYGKACDVYHATGADSTALRWADKAVALAESALDADAQAIRRSQRAYPLEALGRHAQALEDLRFAERVFRASGTKTSLAIVCFQLAQAYGRTGYNASELQYLREAAGLAREIQDLPLLQKILTQLSESLRDSDPRAAYDCLAEAAQLAADIAASKSNNALELFNVEFETARREQTIALQEMDLQRHRRRLSALLVILGILLIAAVATGVSGVRLRRSERNLKQSNDQKDFLFRVISHDIRSPAVAQLRGIQMLRGNADKLDAAGMKDAFLQMERAAGAEVELIENVLRWAQRKPVEPVRFVLNEMVREALQQLAESAALKEVRLRLDAPREFVVSTIRSNVLLALRNLLSNAIKFSRRGGEVVVRLEEAPGGVRLAVSDRGIGIPADRLDSIFSLESPFRRTGTDGEPSNGLGLPISRHLVEEIGGTLTCTSAEGEGSTFIIFIPESHGNR